MSATHRYVFDLKPEEDVYWCAADVGWITGHSYIVYGPLCNGATSVMWEGAPDYPHKGIWWEVAERYDGLLLDLWGVLHNGKAPFPGVIDCLTRLKSAGKRPQFHSF